MVPVRNSRNHVILRRSRLNAKIFLKMHFSTTPTQNHVTFLLFWKVLSYSEFNSASVGPYRTPTQWLYDASRRTLSLRETESTFGHFCGAKIYQRVSTRKLERADSGSGRFQIGYRMKRFEEIPYLLFSPLYLNFSIVCEVEVRD